MSAEVLSEVEKMRRVPGIIFADGPCGRVARVAGTGLEVFEVIGGYHACAEDWGCFRESYHWLSEEQLWAAVRYYREFPEEIDRILDEEAAAVPDDVRRAWQDYLARATQG